MSSYCNGSLLTQILDAKSINTFLKILLYLATLITCLIYWLPTREGIPDLLTGPKATALCALCISSLTYQFPSHYFGNHFLYFIRLSPVTMETIRTLCILDNPARVVPPSPALSMLVFPPRQIRIPSVFIKDSIL